MALKTRGDRRTDAIHEFHTQKVRWSPSSPARSLSFPEYWRTKNDPELKLRYAQDQRRAAARRQSDATQ